ncbi:alpha/beta fold hydrolase [Phycicoccus avicenniae]|uniref:alpha/beta fold hydrolase n=1 Tax=Phycicoccus avicenniae TaxID=2828860 RepID=UPI003D28DD58
MTTTLETPTTARTVTAAGIATTVHVLGDPATQPVVVLVHGSGPGVTAHANWRLTMPALAERFCVVAPDVVGFGSTERPEGFEYSMPAWTAHLVGVLDALGIERADVVGNSFGGGLAASLAVHHPERLRRLVLMGATVAPQRITPGLDAVWGYEPSVENMQALLELFAFDRAALGPDLARLRYEASIATGVQEAYSSMFPAPRQRALDAITQPVAAVATIGHPTLVVHGYDDRVIPVESSIALLGMLPDARLHVFGRCGHWTQIEHADAFNRLVLDFLSS